MTHKNEQPIFNKKEEKLDKEALLREYERLKSEVAEANQSLNDQQKEFAGDDRPTADFFATQALTDHKTKRMKEIEEKLKEPQEQKKEK